MNRGIPSLLLAAALALATPAAAQPRLAVLVAAHEPELVPRSLAVFHALEELARKDARVTVVDVTRKDSAAGTRAARSGEGKRLLAEARAAFAALKPRVALEKSQQAVRALEAGELETDFDALLDALALQALVTHRLGNHAGALPLLERLFTLAPRYEPELRRSTAGFRRLVDEVRGSVAFTPRGTLEVRVDKGAGWLYVDGGYRGVAPMVLEDLPVGEHSLTVLAPGAAPVQGVAKAGPEQTFTALLEPSPEGMEVRRWLGAVTAAYPEQPLAELGPGVAKWAEADVVLLASLVARPGGVEVIAARVPADGKGAAATRAAFNEPIEPEAIAGFLHGLLDAPGNLNVGEVEVVPPVVAAPPPPPPPPPPRLSYRTLGLISVGAAAAMTTGGVLLSVSAANQRLAAERLSPHMGNPAYDQAIANAQRTDIFADVLYGVSLAAAGAGVYLIVRGDEPPAPAAGPAVSLGLLPLPWGGQVSVGGRF